MARTSRTRWLRLVVVLLVPLAAMGCRPSDDERVDGELLTQVETAEIDDRSHVEGSVDYDRVPPLGGPHAPVWANCGFYEQVVPPELAVHSMEHGAVWIAYPEDGDVDIERLREPTVGQPDVLVGPSPDVGTVTATAWGPSSRSTAGQPGPDSLHRGLRSRSEHAGTRGSLLRWRR